MMSELIHILPMAIVVIGAFVLMILSQSRVVDLNRLNLVAVTFLAISFFVELPQFGRDEILYSFSDIFKSSSVSLLVLKTFL